jgi:hypothetical protein
MADIQGTAAGETLAGTGGDDVIAGGGRGDPIEGDDRAAATDCGFCYDVDLTLEIDAICRLGTRRDLPGRGSHELAAEDGPQQGPDERGV